MRTNIILDLWIWFYNKCISLWEIVCSLIPVSSTKIVATNFLGQDYGDNPGFIYNEIIRQGLAYDLVWLQKDMKRDVPKGVRKLRYGNLRCIYELSTARVIINNVKNGLVWKKKKGQYYIQTWHGAFPLKYIEKEVEEQLTAHYVKLSKEDSKRTDLLLSGCKLESEIMRSSFWYSGEIFECGVPRNDIFFHSNIDTINELKDKYGILRDTRIILYAPTFRDSGDISVYNIDAKRIVASLEEKTSLKWVFIIRLHPNVSDKASNFDYNQIIINGSVYPDAQELIVMSDILITDYSSIMMDFGLMRKPVFLYIPDIDLYKNNNRGLRPIFYHLPFFYCKSDEEILNAIIKYDSDKYLSILDSFIKDSYGGFDDGHACERVVERIKNVIGF